MRLVTRYIVLEGFRRRFTALKIVKAEAGFLLKKKYIKPFAIRDRPVLTESYQILHDYEGKGVVKATKKGYSDRISPLSHFKVVDSSTIEGEVKDIREKLQSFNPKLLKELDEWLDFIGKFDEKSIEKIVDGHYLRLIDNIPDLPVYLHPLLSKHINGLPTVDTLEDLFETLKSIMGRKLVLPDDFGDRTEHIRSRIRDWLKNGNRFGSIRMTDPIN